MKVKSCNTLRQYTSAKRNKGNILILVFLILLPPIACVKEFIPVVQEDKELLVVQGLITDQLIADTIKLS